MKLTELEYKLTVALTNLNDAHMRCTKASQNATEVLEIVKKRRPKIEYARKGKRNPFK